MANKPKKTYRAGSLSVTLWENENKDKKKFVTAVISRGYKDKEDNWKNTDSLRVSDMPKVVALLQEAYKELITAKKEEE